MNDSNRSLRFSRSSREAYGYQIRFERENTKDIVAFIVSIFLLGVILGSLL